MMEDMIANVEKCLSTPLTAEQRVVAENMVERGYDSKTIAEQLTCPYF